MANKIRYGLKNLHIALLLEDDSSGDATWDTPLSIPGAIGFKSDPEGDSFTLYADDGAYFNVEINNGHTGELETALIPRSVLADVMNLDVDANGALSDNTDLFPKPFALMGEYAGDASGTRFVYYKCIPTRPAKDSKTKEKTITPATDTIKLTMVPASVAGVNRSYSDIERDDTNGTAYDSFFDSVYIPEPVA